MLKYIIYPCNVKQTEQSVLANGSDTIWELNINNVKHNLEITFTSTLGKMLQYLE